MQQFAVHSGGGELYGPFPTAEEALKWAEKNEEMLGDFDVTEIYKP